MIDLTFEELCLLRVALTHLAVDGKGKCAVQGDAANVFHGVMRKLDNCRRKPTEVKDKGVFSKMVSRDDLHKMLGVIAKYKKQLKWTDDEYDDVSRIAENDEYDDVSRIAENIISELGIGGDEREVTVSKMLLKKGFAKKMSALLLEKTQELLDGLDDDIMHEPTIGEEECTELLNWADKFVDTIANHAVMVCLKED